MSRESTYIGWLTGNRFSVLVVIAHRLSGIFPLTYTYTLISVCVFHFLQNSIKLRSMPYMFSIIWLSKGQARAS